MSEILQEEVIANENGVSRRRVVAGVAWSLPVIATAIAAPAAAASVVPPSVSWGAAAAAPATGSDGQLTVQGQTAFVIQTGTAFTGSSISYVITITGDKSEQNAKLGVSSVSLGTGSPQPILQGDKSTTFTGTLAAAPGSQAMSVVINGFTYTKPNKPGAYTYTAALSATIGGVTPTQAVATLTVTFP